MPTRGPRCLRAHGLARGTPRGAVPLAVSACSPDAPVLARGRTAQRVAQSRGPQAAKPRRSKRAAAALRSRVPATRKRSIGPQAVCRAIATPPRHRGGIVGIGGIAAGATRLSGGLTGSLTVAAQFSVGFAAVSIARTFTPAFFWRICRPKASARTVSRGGGLSSVVASPSGVQAM